MYDNTVDIFVLEKSKISLKSRICTFNYLQAKRVLFNSLYWHFKFILYSTFFVENDL